jgi:hypothetical protein
MQVIFDHARQLAQIGSLQVPIEQTVGGAIRLNPPDGTLVRALTFGERNKLVALAASRPDPAQALVDLLVEHALVASGEPDLTAVIVALALNGAQYELPSFVQTAALAANVTGQSTANILTAPAAEVDALASEHLGWRKAANGWQRFAIVSSPAEELAVIFAELSENLLGRNSELAETEIGLPEFGQAATLPNEVASSPFAPAPDFAALLPAHVSPFSGFSFSGQAASDFPANFSQALVSGNSGNLSVTPETVIPASVSPKMNGTPPEPATSETLSGKIFSSPVAEAPKAPAQRYRYRLRSAQNPAVASVPPEVAPSVASSHTFSASALFVAPNAANGLNNQDVFAPPNFTPSYGIFSGKFEADSSWERVGGILTATDTSDKWQNDAQTETFTPLEIAARPETFELDDLMDKLGRLLHDEADRRGLAR